MKGVLERERNVCILLAILALVVFGSNIWGVDIYILDEAKNAECAREMFVSGNYVVPYFNGELRTDKPPLHYFFMNLAFYLFGVNAFAARFFSVVMGMATVLISYGFTKKHLDKTTALWVAIILLSAANFALEFHLAVPDPYLIFFINLGLFCFIDFYLSGKRGSLWLMYIALGLAALSKGPVGIALPGLIFLVFLIVTKGFSSWQKGWETIKCFQIPIGILIVLALTLPWYLAVGFETDWEWTRGFFFDHNINRFSDTRESHGGKFFLTPAFVLIGMLPFTLFVVQAFSSFFKNRKNPFLQFAFISGLVIVGFFTLSSTKLPNYPMPSYPVWAVLFAFGLSNVKPKSLDFALTINLILGIGLVFGVYQGFDAEKGISHLVHLVHYLWFFPALGAVLLFVPFKTINHKLWGLAISWMLLMGVIFYGIYPQINRQNPVAQAQQVLPDDVPIVAFGKFNSAFMFNLQQRVPKFRKLEEVEEHFEKYPNSYLLTTNQDQKELETLPGFELLQSTPFLFEPGTSLVYRRVGGLQKP